MPKTQTGKQFIVVDPRAMDGDPYAVAERACQQAAGVAKVLAQLILPTRLMVRNAELERQDKPDPLGWENGPQGRKLEVAENAALELERELSMLAAAAGYDPKNPPKE